MVNVCSRAGPVSSFGEPARGRLVAAASRGDVEALAQDFVASVRGGPHLAKQTMHLYYM